MKGRGLIVPIILVVIGIYGIHGTLGINEETSVMTEEDCRICHNGSLSFNGTLIDRHHLLCANGDYNCIDCHEMKWDNVNLSYYPEVIRDCLVCHVDKNHTNTHHLLVEAGLYECFDCHEMKWDNVTQSYYPEVIWDCPICHASTTSDPPVNPNAPTGVHSSISCSTCHVELSREETCYQCHNNPDNSYQGVNIYAQFTANTDYYGGMGTKKGYYNTVNTRHDITDEDQNYSSTRLECTNCHSAHLASRDNILIDPDERSTPFNKTMIHPATSQEVLDTITFCLKCHDNTWAYDNTVVGPTTIINILEYYLDPTGKGDEHGAANGSGKSILRGPYESWGNSKDVPPIPCLDCHDPHGSNNLYHLRTLTDQNGVPVTITSENIDDHIVANWCSHCHDNPMNQFDTKKDGCLSSSCHTHSSKSF